MPIYSPIEPGTIVFLDFDQFGFEKPEMEGPHPAVVITRKNLQKDGTTIIVPITSAESNKFNNCAVELQTKKFIASGGKRRAFAVCNKPLTVALDRLDYYVGKQELRQAGKNKREHYALNATDLQNVRTGVFMAIAGNPEVKEAKSKGTKLGRIIERIQALRNRSRQT